MHQESGPFIVLKFLISESVTHFGLDCNLILIIDISPLPANRSANAQTSLLLCGGKYLSESSLYLQL